MMNEIDIESVVAALTGEASEEQERRLKAWLASDAENEEEYRRLAGLWDAAGELAMAAEVPPVPDVGSITALDSRELEVAGERDTRPPPRWRHVLVPLAAAASLAIGLGLGGLWRDSGRFGPASLVTGPDEVVTVTLSDGSVARLAPDSRISFRAGDERREVSLVGRAYFAVAKDDGRPFTVIVPEGEVEVLGTRFDVQSRDAETQVTVVEGQVRVLAGRGRVEVGANQSVRATEFEIAAVESLVDPFEVIDWLGRFLAFESTPLSDVAVEFEDRFGTQIEIPDPELRERTVTGWFADQTPSSMIAAICRVVGAHCTTMGDDVFRMEVPVPQGSRAGTARAAGSGLEDMASVDSGSTQWWNSKSLHSFVSSDL